VYILSRISLLKNSYTELQIFNVNITSLGKQSILNIYENVRAFCNRYFSWLSISKICYPKKNSLRVWICSIPSIIV